MLKRIVSSVILVLFLNFPLWQVRAVETSTWKQKSQEEFAKGEAENISLTGEDEVILAPSLDLIYDTGQLFVWSLVEDSKGNLFAGTGNEGKIFKIKKGGEASLFYDSEELQILSLAIDNDDNLYAGTAPGGLVVKIEPQGKATILFDSSEQYVWSLEFDRKGILYAATGNKAKIYKVRKERTEVFYDCPEAHLLSLLFDSRDNLYTGSGGNGILYKISPKGDVRALYDSPREEVHSLVLDKEGNLYLGTTGKLEDNSKGENVPPEGEKESPLLSEGEKENPILYKVDSQGVVSKIFSLPTETLLSMIFNEKGNLLVGTGKEGKIYEITLKKKGTFLLECDDSHILKLYKAKGNKILMGTGNTGKIYQISPQFAGKGTLESSVRDSGAISKWGRVSWEALLPQGTGISFQTRTGNTEKPDDTWSDWSSKYRSSGEEIKSPPARFIQWRATLSTKKRDLTPKLKEVRLAYLVRNLPPEIKSVTVRSPSLEMGGEGEQKSPPKPGEKKMVRGQKKVEWGAEDPNKDKLKYDLYFKGTEEKKWKLLKEDLEKNFYIFDSWGFPQGIYEFKVVASDSPSNPQPTALTSEEISKPFTIDTTGPRVKNLEVKALKGKWQVKGRAEDDLSIITGIEYSLNARQWQMVNSSDEVYDSKKEDFSFSIPLSPGEHTLVIKVRDEEGNIGAGKKILREK
jgi:hypothetical protein